MNWIQSFFKWTGMYPVNPFSSQSYYLNRNAPILIDTADLACVVESCPYLQLVIHEKAKMFSNMEIKLVKESDGTEIEKHEVLTLLHQPNVLQAQETFLKQYSVMRDIFANNFIYKLQATSFSTPKALWNLPSSVMKIVPTGKIYKQTEIDEIIEKYLLCWNSEEIVYNTNEVIFKAENAKLISGVSKLIALRVPISNIIGALKTRNVIIHDRGAMGILSNDSKDDGGSIPLGSKEREDIQKEYANKYGIDTDSAGLEKQKIIITNSSLKWSPMSFPTKDLLLFEEIEEDFGAILGAYGMDRDIFPSTKGATFENKKQALKSTYQNTIQPEADDLMNTLTDGLGLERDGVKLVASYDWLPIMQEDEVKVQQVEKTKAETLSIMLRDGVINREAYAEAMGVEMTGVAPVQTTPVP